MKELIEKFENTAPELVYEWKDEETGAEGWLVINSLRGGAAGGGTRMRKGVTRKEVVDLAKTMEVKFSCCGPLIGGAKSGINFDPEDPRKEEVLQKWFKRVVPILKAYYGTGGDMNVDEVKDVIPITENLGLQHPQEGVLTGHYNPDEAGKTQKIQQLREGVSKVVDDPRFTPSLDKPYKVADLITGYGVSESVGHWYDLQGEPLKNKGAIIQGWGNVGAAAAYYLAQQGVLIKGIIDRAGGILSEEGLGYEDIKELFLKKEENRLVSSEMLSFEKVNQKIWDTSAEIFIPAAASNLLEMDHLHRLYNAGLETISCGANVPFADEKLFLGKISEKADEMFSVIPDFIANSGMARAFAYLMQDDIEMTDQAIFDDVSTVVRENLATLMEREPNNRFHLNARGFNLAIERAVF